MEFREVVRRRRMVRHFENEPVERDVLERIAATAQRAPSAGFSQGQRVLIITEPAGRQLVADLLHEEEDVAEGWDRWVSECAALFVPCVSERIYHARYQQPDKIDESGREIDWPVPYWFVDVGCTAMLILLAAIDEGLAAGFSGILDIPEFRAALGIPEEFTPVGVIPVGRPLPDRRSPSLKRGRLAFDEFARWERW